MRALKPERTEIKLSQTIVKESIDLTGEYGLYSQTVKKLTVLEIVGVSSHFNTVKQFIEDTYDGAVVFFE